ncbi:hypothetical protein [Paenibacillus sp. Leaf72]|uniref:hypothetical protein n=1 Tax=Paenibacillus sp. Leaf72 TaxID=1736234 RepID=UPI0006F94A59|nr:hypothetical protein [Paenibacillus sp. Leaf72]KQO12069.1 hypothetical protein ASF12_31725 [Paenibacillus sp. Leaf72]
MRNEKLVLVLSLFLIFVGFTAILFGYWEALQPKTGPVGNGATLPTFLQILPSILAIVTGILNLAHIVYRRRKAYFNNKDNQENKDQNPS